MTYSHDGYGMGHLRRNVNLATRLVRDLRGASVLMLGSCSSGPYFELAPGIDFIKIPSIIKVGGGAYEPSSLKISRDRVKALRSVLIQKAAEVFQPHLLLVDHVPGGVWDELIPTLQMLRRRAAPPVVVLGMRDITDTPEVVRQQWQREGTYELLDRYYDEVLVYGCRRLFDSAAEYGLGERLSAGVTYCGYVASQEPPESAPLRAELGISDFEKLILVTGGGGGDAYPMMSLFLEALPLVKTRHALAPLVIAGPLMAPDQKGMLRKQARSLGVRVLSHTPDSLSYLHAADLVITMGGYNSLAEIVSLRKKAIVLPRVGPRAEQTMRARIFAEERLVNALQPRDWSAPALAAHIATDLDRTDYPRRHLDVHTQGATVAVARLRELMAMRRGNLQNVEEVRSSHLGLGRGDARAQAVSVGA
ncbi:MAG TPA: glycosyltransferase [Terriglobia bacterium]|nr:glycosyltransferase [Terriglobia bacterium]